MAFVRAPIDKVWKYWTTPEDIIRWNAAQEDWHTVRAENDLRNGGKFLIRMKSKDGSSGFDFEGEYDDIKMHEHIEYTMGDGRRVYVKFQGNGSGTNITETFDVEKENPAKIQKDGWQAILNNFKRYAEKRK